VTHSGVKVKHEMSEAPELNRPSSEDGLTTAGGASSDAVTSQHDVADKATAGVTHSAGGELRTTASDAAGDGRSGPGADDAVDGGAHAANEEPRSGAAVPSEPVEMVGTPVHSAASAGQNSAVTHSDNVVDRSTSGQDCPGVEPPAAGSVVDVAAKPGDAAAGGDGVRPGPASEKSRPSSTVGPAATLTARHALPSAVAAPRATGKHRLPPVLTSSGQAHGLERVSPLSLVVGPASADSVRASPSLTGGTRLGDLGLSQPPLNLSVSDEAVNMKIASTIAQRSAADAASRGGTYSERLIVVLGSDHK